MTTTMTPRVLFGRLWLVLLASVFIYAIIGSWIPGLTSTLDFGTARTIRMTLLYAAAVVLVIGVILPQVLAGEAKLRSLGSRSSADRIVLVAGIASLAMVESVAIFGIMLRILTGRSRDLYMACAIAVVAMARQRFDILSRFDRVEREFPPDMG